MDLSIIERTKIQAQVLVPLVKALRAELGQARADAIVAKALGGLYRGYGEAWARRRKSSNLIEGMAETVREGWAADGALDYDVVKQDAETLAVNITGCRYAEFYKAMGDPELGFLLVCSADFPLVEGMGGLDLERTQTIMQGASHCDFRFAIKKKA
jgi:hypothetical protein